jgi:hypothetical protein
MHATCSNLPQGPALLARAGVDLADAQWLYRRQRGGLADRDRRRLDGIRRKVYSFLAESTAPLRALPAPA